MIEHICVVCGHIHDEEIEGLWDELPTDFTCPECGVGKDEYEVI
jgi:rubredoxin